MIKSEKGEALVRGEVYDIIFECNRLIRMLTEVHPEIISAVIFKNADGLHRAIEKSDKDKLQAVEDYIDHIGQTRKELNDET